MITEEIRALRRSGIGGSDVGAILGLSPFKTAIDVYNDKTSDTDNDVNNEAVYWGSVLEDVIIDRFCAEHPDVTVERSPDMVRDFDHEWMLANLDGVIHKDGTQGVLEIKTANAFSTDKWGETGSAKIPASYEAQVRWYMAVMDMPYAIVCVLIGGQDYREFRIERDEEKEAEIVEAMRDFWFNHVQKGIPPEPKSNSEAVALLSSKEAEATSVEADFDIYEEYQKLKTLKESLKEMTALAKEYENNIKVAIGKASTITFDGNPFASWTSHSKNLFDMETFKTMHPDLYQKYLKESSYRRFSIK